MNTYDWLSDIEIPGVDSFRVAEISFKNGVRKDFYYIKHYIHCSKDDLVVVENDRGGYTVGKVSLTGELVKLQMKKRRVPLDAKLPAVVRIANEADTDKLKKARNSEQDLLRRARVIARQHKLNMKISLVEAHADLKRVTFYYIAEQHVDFRELLKTYSQEFNMRVELRQVKERVEAGMIGGIGTCGRELCCSTWLNSFKKTTQVSARYQGLSLNSEKLVGQCGRLKCCLNYELETYIKALKHFPKKGYRSLRTQAGKAFLLKQNVFEGTMIYAYKNEVGKHYSLPVERVKEIIFMNRQDQLPEKLLTPELIAELQEEEIAEVGYDSDELTGFIELDPLKKKRRTKRRKPQSKRNTGAKKKSGDKKQGQASAKPNEQRKPKSNRRKKPNTKKAAEGAKPAHPTDPNHKPKSEKSDQQTRNKKRRPNKNRNRKPRPPKDQPPKQD